MTETDITNPPATPAASEPEAMTFAEFLESVPPSQAVEVKSLCSTERRGSTVSRRIRTPELMLHCTSDICNGTRFFRFTDSTKDWFDDEHKNIQTYLNYVCSNCTKTTKMFSLYAVLNDDNSGQCYKFGEYPPYGPPTPARLIRLVESDRDLFLKGRHCETQGLGIGAFVYYRRVVESHKNRILDEIIRASEKIGAAAEMIATLENAKKEVQFAEALESVKDAIPQALLINGHNPMTLLHSALSGGLHEQTDERCLERAHDVRVVLIELAERLGQALKDEAELNTAVARLLQRTPPTGA
jgi:hypothetical protein